MKTKTQAAHVLIEAGWTIEDVCQVLEIQMRDLTLTTVPTPQQFKPYLTRTTRCNYGN